MTEQLTLQPESSAARIARRWIRDELSERERPDLMESAVLGVSELVTNALLHVRSPISIRIVEVGHRLRIEVYDDSPRAPEGRPTIVVDTSASPATIGRGLQIVDSISLSWGVAYEDHGKCVWFQPMPEGTHPSGQDPDEGQPLPEKPAPAAGMETISVTLVDVPIKLLEHYRVRFRDLRRELTLIALQTDDHGHGQAAVGGRLNDVALRLETFGPIGSDAEKIVEEALGAGRDRIDLPYDLPLAAVPGIVELQELIHEADAFCRSEALLTLAAGPQETALRDWYLGELVAQAGGAAPTPWPGEFVVTDPEYHG